MYDQFVTRSNPALFVFLIDRSTSMVSNIAGREQSKAEFVADALNLTLGNLALACAREEGVRDYVHVAILGYGADVASSLPGGAERRSISALADAPLRLERRRTLLPDGAGGVAEREIELPIWVEPAADGLTPMVEALGRAAAICEQWVREFPRSFPPTVINLTDGGATDGDPVGAAELLRKVESDDGATLLINVHVSEAGGERLLFPVSADELHQVDDPLADQLFEMSSQLPPILVEQGASSGLSLRSGARGMTYLADASDVVRTLNLGTSTVSGR